MPPMSGAWPLDALPPRTVSCILLVLLIKTSLSCMPLHCCNTTAHRATLPHLKPSWALSSYCVTRDTLFSYHKASEEFLHRLMSLYVASHYKNTPNDLQLLSDAPAHHIFVLLGPVHPASTSLPEILCVLHHTLYTNLHTIIH